MKKWNPTRYKFCLAPGEKLSSSYLLYQITLLTPGLGTVAVYLHTSLHNLDTFSEQDILDITFISKNIQNKIFILAYLNMRI